MAAFLVAALLPLCPAEAQPARAVTVEAVTLKPMPLVESVSSVGNLVADESVIIRPEVDGRIVEIAFEEGQPVKVGQLLFRLDAAVYEAQLQEAEAREDLTKRTFERAKALHKRGHSSAEVLDKALSEMKMAEASVALNKARLEKMRIVAPFRGTVGLRQVSLGAFVEAKTDLVSLVNLDSLEVEFRLPERYYRVIAEGGVVRAEPDALPGEVFEGRIFAVAPAIDINGRSIAVKAKLVNPEGRLRPGMFARVKLVVDRRNDAIVVPESAIVQRGDGQFVYRIRDGKAELTPVRLGLRQTGRIEVVEGLAAGDTVVTAGQVKLRPGATVKVADFSAPAATN
jgi:membrane fusion protein, multidrug efflux system